MMMVRPVAVLAPTVPPAPAAPLTPLALGSVVGVPTGASLTASSGLGTNDGTTSITLTHPITGAQNTVTATRYYRRRWTSTVYPSPALGQVILFDECEFSVASDFYVVDLAGAVTTSDIMQPSAVFRRCTLTGNDTCTRTIVEGHAWAIGCHITGSEDGWGGCVYSVAVDSNIIATTDGQVDPHSDGLQTSSLGYTVLHHCWIDSGSDPAASNAAVRVGTEDGNNGNTWIYYCGLAGEGSYSIQFRTPVGPVNNNNHIVGNRWSLASTAAFGPVDYDAGVTFDTWADNAWSDGTPITNPAPPP